MFRDLLQGRLLDTSARSVRLEPLTLANSLTALAFTAFHLPRGGLLLAAGIESPVAGACRPEPELVAACRGTPRQHIACH